MGNYYIIHLCVFVAGFILSVLPPKKINWLYGYRTQRSMKNEHSFEYANKLSAKLLMLFSAISFLISLLAIKLFNYNAFWLIFIGLFFTIIITERRLKKFNTENNFDSNYR